MFGVPSSYLSSLPSLIFQRYTISPTCFCSANKPSFQLNDLLSDFKFTTFNVFIFVKLTAHNKVYMLYANEVSYLILNFSVRRTTHIPNRYIQYLKFYDIIVTKKKITFIKTIEAIPIANIVIIKVSKSSFSFFIWYKILKTKYNNKYKTFYSFFKIKFILIVMLFFLLSSVLKRFIFATVSKHLRNYLKHLVKTVTNFKNQNIHPLFAS